MEASKRWWRPMFGFHLGLITCAKLPLSWHKSAANQALSLLTFGVLFILSPSHVIAQTLEGTAPAAADAPADLESAAASSTQPVAEVPAVPQTTATTASSAGAPGGETAPLPGVGERVPGMVKVESGGSATYEVGIIVPPGIVAPTLSLAYDSQGSGSQNHGKNGLIGVGWSIKGLSTIQRCPRTRVQDGVAGTVNYDNNDRFCLDGARLMAISGTYGANLTEYRTEVDNFIKVISYGQAGSGPAFFKAWTKAGDVMEFGSTPDSAIEAQNKTSVRVWALNRKQDVKGNYFTTTYAEDNPNGDYRPIRIDYTGNIGIPTTRRIEFAYEPRPNESDITKGYVGGSIIRTTQRLKNIKTFAPSPFLPPGSAAVLVREYRLAYEISASTQRSRLLTVSECDPTGLCATTFQDPCLTDGSCLPPHRFTWQGGSRSLPLSTWTNNNLSGTHPGANLVGDLNGDGKQDIVARGSPCSVHISNGAGFNVQPWTCNLDGNGNGFNYVGDFDGDGKSDILARINGTSCSLHLSTGTGFTITIVPCSLNGSHIGHNLVGDFDADGRSDIVSKSNNACLLHLSTGSGFGVPITVPACNLRDDRLNYVGDFDGDGKSDIASRIGSTQTCNVRLSTGTGFTPKTWTCSFDANGFNLVGDFNGDNKTDVVNVNNGTAIVNLSKGTDFDVQTWAVNLNQSGYVWAGDFDGDGRTDLVSKSAGDCTIFYSTGASFIGVGNSGPCNLDSDGFNYLGDFTGDGRVDVAIRQGPNNVSVLIPPGPAPDLLTSISTNFGGTIDITYKPITDSSVYTKDTAPPYAAAYPIQDIQQPIHVVSDLTFSDPGNSYAYSYIYAGAKKHLLGRGWLGFRMMDSLDESAGARNITFFNQGLDQGVAQFDQNFPKIGSPQSTELESMACALPNNLVTQMEHGYTITSPFTGVKRLLQTTVDKYEWECGSINRHTRTSFAFDSFGNLTQTLNEGVVDVAGDERDEQTEWVVDVANWLHRQKKNELKDGTGATLRRKWLFYDKQAHGVLTGPGLLTKEEHDAGSGTIGSADNAVFEFDHDGVTGAPTFAKDPRLCENTTTYESTKTFPDEVRTCTNIPSLNFLMKYVYDPRFGTKISEKNWDNQETTFQYDAFGRPMRKTTIKDFLTGSPNGTETYAYLEWGTINQRVRTSKTIEHGQSAVLVTDNFFDGFGRTDQVQTDGPGGSTIIGQSIFDSRNLVVEKFAPRFLTEAALPSTMIEYDALGREVKVTHPDNRFARKEYAPGQITLFDELARQKILFIDPYGQLSQVREFNAGTPYDTFYSYNAAGQLTEIENSQGHLTEMEYDRLGRKTAMCDPNMGTPSNVGVCTATAPATPGAWIYTHNAAGDVLTQKDPKNQTICYSYDQLGRPTNKKQGQNCTTSLVNFTYDTTAIPGADFPKGKLTQVFDVVADVTTKFAYDELGRVAKSQRVILGATHTMTQQYDALNRKKLETFPDNDPASYIYDGPWLKSITGYINEILYNARGQKTALTYTNNVVTTSTYFDQSGDSLKNFKIKRRITSNSLQDLQYTYDFVGNITSITDSIWTGTRNLFQYDDLNRLTHAEGTFGPSQNSLPTFLPCDYTYNSIGNLLNKCSPQAFVYGDAMHPSAVTFNPVTGKNYSYDANGNMITRGNQTLTWDFENRVTSVSLSGATTTMEYDYTGTRVKKFAPSASSPTQYPFKGYEIDPQGMITKFIKIGVETLASKETPLLGATKQFFYHNDHLGGVNVISQISGAKEQLVEYDPWGSVSRSEGPTLGSQPTVDTTHAFTGQEIDPETGLYYYGGRYYDAEIARFISPDVLVQAPDNPQALNRYSYVINNPVLLTDPTGQIFGIDDLIVGAVIGASMGAMKAAITGQSIWRGMLTGAVSGAIFAGVANFVGNAIAHADVPGGIGPPTEGMALAGKIGGGVAGGAAAGAAGAGINHSNVGQGILIGGISGGVASLGVPNMKPFGEGALGSIGNRVFNASLTGAFLGAAYSGITGGNVGQGAAMGALSWVAGDAGNSLIGHAVGFIGSGGKAPIFMDGVFVYGGNPQGSITIGNAVWGSARGMSPDVFTHEQQGHSLFQGILLGPAYLPAHIIDKATFSFSLEYSRMGLGGAPTYNDLPVDHPPTWWRSSK